MNNYNVELMTQESKVESCIYTIYRFLQSRPESILRMADLWKLVKANYPNEPIVKYWADLNKTKHGIPVEVAKSLKTNRRFKVTYVGSREAYIELYRKWEE